MARGKPEPNLPHDPLPGGLKHNPFAILRQKSDTAGTSDARAAEPSTASTGRLARDASPHRSDDATQHELPRDARSSAPRPKSAPPKHASSPAGGTADPAQRVVVRRERKGRGGKAVTIAEGPGLARHDLEALARDAARALGTGARVEDGTLVIQGDQADRLLEWLVKRGFLHCTRGN